MARSVDLSALPSSPSSSAGTADANPTAASFPGPPPLCSTPRAGILFLWIALCGSSAPPKVLAEESLPVLDAAMDAYLSKAQFHCTYLLKEGTAPTFADALAGRFSVVQNSIRGQLTRKGKMLRCSTDYGRPPTRLAPDRVTDESEDVMSDGSVIVRYVIPHGEPTTGVMLGRATQRQYDRTIANLPQPLNLLGGPIRNPLLRPCPECPDQGFSRSIAAEQGDDVQVQTLDPNQDGVTRTTIFIDLSHDPAIVKKIQVVGNHAGIENNRAEVIALDHVSVGGVLIPRKIRLAIGPGLNSPCLAREWTASNLRLPADSDFVLPLPPRTNVSGRKTDNLTPNPAVIRLTNLSADQLQDGSEALLAFYASRPRISPTSWYLIIAGLMLFGLTILFWCAIQRRRSA